MKTVVVLSTLVMLAGCGSVGGNMALGCLGGGAVGVAGDYAIASPTSGLLPLVGCAVGVVAGAAATPDSKTRR